MEIMNFICLIIWILQLVVATVKVVNGKPVSPVVAICAILVCIMMYIDKIQE